MEINQYANEAFQINDEDFYDVDYWTGTAFETRKISGLTLKTLLGQNATTAKREIVQFINKTGSELSEGTIVYLKTSSSSSEYPEVELADASTEATSSKTIGAVYATVADDEIGIIVTSGEVDNLDTSMYNIGDRLWLSTTAGQVTTTVPVSPDHAVFIGIVTRSQNGNGRILYRIINGYELGELHDVLFASTPNDGDVLTYDSATGLWKNESASGGLTEFTEAENTAAPNATVPVNSLTPVTATTNADFAIVPKGTGAFMLDIPDNTTAGGNKRGANSVDLQTSRINEFKVASGIRSIILAGNSNTSTGTNAISGGDGSTASGDNSVALGNANSATANSAIALGWSNTASFQITTALGYLNTASGNASFAAGSTNTTSGAGGVGIGWNNIASGGNAIAIGKSSTAAGTSTVAIGDGNTSNGYGSASVGTSNSVASQDFNYAFGYSNSISAGAGGNVSYALALGIGHVVNAPFAVGYGGFALTNSIAGRHSFSSNRIATPGDAQKSIFIYRGRTTDNVLTTLATDAGNSINSTNSMQLSNNSAYRFKGTVIGKQSGSVNVAAWDVDGLIVRGASAAATTLVVGNVNLVSNTPAWGTPVLSAFIDAFNGVGALRLQIQGAAATNIQWTATLETTEVIYA